MTTSTLSAWPQSWSLPQPPAGVSWLQRDLQQRQLQAVPPIRDDDGAKPQGSSTSELPPDLVEDPDLPGLLDIVRSPRPVAPPPAGSYHAALRLQSNHIGSVEPSAFVRHTGLEPRTSGLRARPQGTHTPQRSSAARQVLFCYSHA